MSMGRGGMFGDPRLPMEKEQEEQMLRLLSPGLRGQIEQSQEMGGLLSPEDEAARFEAIGGLLAPERPQGFWQGGGKFGVKDGIAGLLAAAGDALMAQAGMGGGAVQGLAGGRMSAMDDLKKQAAQEQKMRELIAIGQANGLSEAQVRMQHAGLEGPEQPKQHELQQLASLANDPTQPPEVREAAKRKLADDPYLTGVNLPTGGQYFGRASGLPGVAGSLGGGGGGADQTPTVEDGYQYTPGPGGRANQSNWKPVGGGTGNGARPF